VDVSEETEDYLYCSQQNETTLTFYMHKTLKME